MAIQVLSEYLAAERRRLLRFMAGSRVRDGFGWLGGDGTVDPGSPVELWITCRMTHVSALGVLAHERRAADGPDDRDLLALAEHGVASLAGPLHDAQHGGWFASVVDGRPLAEAKQAYGHAFVMLAASSAVAAGIKGSRRLLDRALDTWLTRFWDEDAGLSVEEWNREWTALDGYRGVNANMHAVEALLAVGDVTGDPAWHARAARIAATVAEWAATHDWRIPEHFTSEWEPIPDHNRDDPGHPFRPYGATVGHALEWARLLLAVDASLGATAPRGLRDASERLFRQAVRDGWAVDGQPGFVYTTDWEGLPVVHERMHWVLAEAVSAAEALAKATGDERYRADALVWWQYADLTLIDHDAGSWHHELDAANCPSATVWRGKPDVYHAYQAALLPELPLTPSFAAALAKSGGVS